MASITPSPPATGPQPIPLATIATPEAPVLDQRPLTIWVLHRFSELTEFESDSFLVSTVRQFERDHPQLRVEFVTKADEGEASLFNFLRSTHRVAPTLLPDMILFDARRLWQITQLGVLQPLATDQMIHSDGFFPFALQAVTVDGQQYAIPYFADILHLVYLQNKVTTPPATWQALLDTKQRFIFPSVGQDGANDRWLLSSYLSAGGQIRDTVTEADRQALAAMLTFFAEGKAQGAIPAEVTTVTGTDALWSTIANEEIEMAGMPAHDFLRYGSTVEGFGFAALPGYTDSSPTLAQVWAFAILANDEHRRHLAVTLLDRFLSPATHGQWSMATSHLPTREEAWRTWNTDIPYAQFLHQQLQEALALPATQQTTDFVKRLQQAQNGILTGQQALQQILADFR